MNILKSLFGDRSIASSLGANLLTKVVLTISQLVLIPIYLKYWGNIIYGDWLIITTIPNYLMISDFGLNATASNEFCRLIAQQKHQEAFKLFRAVNSCFLVFGICLLCLFYTTISIANLKELLSINELSEIDTRLIIFFYCINITASLLQTFISCVFRAHDKFFISQNYTTLVYLVDLVIIVFVVVSGNKAFFIPLLFIFNRTLIIIFQLTHAIKMSWLREVNVFSKNLRSAVTLIPTSFNHSLITLGFAIVLQGNTFLVGRYLGSQAVVEFNTIRTLVNSMKSFFSVVYASFFPKFTILYAKGNLEELSSKYKDLMVIVVVGSLIACGIFLFWGNDIFLIWTKGKVLLRFPFYYIMLVGALMQIIWNGASSLPFSLNENKLLKYYPLIAILGIILCIPFMSKWGLNIVAVSLVFVDFIMLILVLYVSRKIINGKI